MTFQCCLLLVVVVVFGFSYTLQCCGPVAVISFNRAIKKTPPYTECMLFQLKLNIFLVFLRFSFVFYLFVYRTEDNEQREHLLNILKQKAQQNAQYKTSSVHGKALSYTYSIASSTNTTKGAGGTYVRSFQDTVCDNT